MTKEELRKKAEEILESLKKMSGPSKYPFLANRAHISIVEAFGLACMKAAYEDAEEAVIRKAISFLTLDGKGVPTIQQTHDIQAQCCEAIRQRAKELEE